MTIVTRHLTSLLVGFLMCAAAITAVGARPSRLLKDGASPIRLAESIPPAFGDWRIDPSVVPVAPPPELQAVLDKTYDQTLSRTYINGRGRRVMLSIAHGGKHGEGMQTHRPEICYPAQGFQIFNETLAELATKYGALPVKRLVAAQGSRREPITYWVVVGDQQTRFGFAMKLAQVKYGLTGKIPDGILVRVSSLDRNDTDAYQIQDSFLRDMLSAIRQRDLVHIAGKFGA